MTTGMAGVRDDGVMRDWTRTTGTEGRWAPHWLYWLITSGFAALIVGTGFISGSGPFDPVLIEVPDPMRAGLLLCSAVAIYFRHRLPVATLLVVVVAASIGRSSGTVVLGFDFATMISIYAVAVRLPRVRAIALAAAAVLVVVVPSLIARETAWAEGVPWQVLLTVGFAFALGDATRSRALQMRALADRAERAELTRESEARRQVSEERLRIARDLHDAVAHQIAVISLHAGAARNALAERPTEAEKSLAVIGDAAREVLGEISALLGLLRHDDEVSSLASSSATLAPAQGVATIVDLVAVARANGVTVDFSIRGKGAALAAAVDSVAYRVAKEALTNAYKHGDSSTVTLSLTWLPSELVIDCRNGVASAPSPALISGGHGLLGMRELVEGIGGRLSLKGLERKFRVVASLPAGDKPS